MKIIETWAWLNEWILWILLGVLVLKFLISLYEFNKFLKSRPNKRILKDLFKNETFDEGEETIVIKWWMKVLMLIGTYITFLFVQKWFRHKVDKMDDTVNNENVNK